MIASILPVLMFRIPRLYSRRSIFLALSTCAILPRLPAVEPAVAEFHDVAWSAGDNPRIGAAEMTILMRVAQLRQGHPLAGLVCVGNRDGAFHPSTEDTLTRVALMGVPIVKLALSSAMPVNPDDVFIEAGILAPATAKRLLADCLGRFGAPPAAVDPSHPTARELAAVYAKLVLYQSVFDAANPTRLASR